MVVAFTEAWKEIVPVSEKGELNVVLPRGQSLKLASSIEWSSSRKHTATQMSVHGSVQGGVSLAAQQLPSASWLALPLLYVNLKGVSNFT